MPLRPPFDRGRPEGTRIRGKVRGEEALELMRREMTTHVPVEHMRREELAELETVLLLEELANEDPKTKRKDQLFFFPHPPCLHLPLVPDAHLSIRSMRCRISKTQQHQARQINHLTAQIQRPGGRLHLSVDSMRRSSEFHERVTELEDEVLTSEDVGDVFGDLSEAKEERKETRRVSFGSLLLFLFRDASTLHLLSLSLPPRFTSFPLSSRVG